MICETCGRLLNRATGKCVCEAYGGNAPPPVASTHPPPEAVRPVSTAAVMAALDVTDRPPRVERPRPAPAPVAPPPPAPARATGAPSGSVSGVRTGRWRGDAVAFDGCLVLARSPRGKDAASARASMSSAQLANLHPSNRLIAAAGVAEVDVREDRLGGRARIKLTSGDPVVLSWWGLRNRSLDAEHLLADAFPGKVDKAGPDIAKRVFKAVVAAVVAAVGLVGASIGLSALLAADPPPPAPVAPPVTVPPAVQAARAELATVCPPWDAFLAGVPAGDRPPPAALRPIVDGMRAGFDAAAAAVPEYGTARDELGYLQDYARRPPDAIARESVSRVNYAVTQVSAACARRA